MKTFLFIISTLLFCGCSTIEYKEVYIPTKCDIPYPKIAKKTDDIIENQKNLVVYTLELEDALNCCIKGECE